MTTINSTQIRTQEVKAADTGTTTAQGADDVLVKVDDALARIEKMESTDGEWLSEENRATLARIKMTLQSCEAAVEAIDYVNGIPTAGTTGSADPMNAVDSLAAGWNGCAAPDFSDPAGLALIADDTAKYGAFMGSIYVTNSGDPKNPTVFGFQMTEDMIALKGETKGRDIIITATIDTNHDGKESAGDEKRSWVIKDGTLRPEPLVISANGLSRGVKIDMSNVYRIKDTNNPDAHSVYIWGSNGNDTIYGSQSDDKIAGMKGDDLIYGLAGNDTIFGDELYNKSGEFSPDGGNDMIDGGAGGDAIYGGGGAKDKTYASDAGEDIFEAEFMNSKSELTDPPSTNTYFTADPNNPNTWKEATNENGMVTFRHTTGQDAGTINLNVPPGYSMAYGERDEGNSLIITFVGIDITNGHTKSFRVKLENFFGELTDSKDPKAQIPTLNIKGNGQQGDVNIIDMGRIEVTSQVINITDGPVDSNTDDIIIGAHNKLISEGVNARTVLTGSTADSVTVTDAAAAMLTAYGADYKIDNEVASTGGYEAKTIPGKNIIQITADGVVGPDPNLKLKAPQGFESFYITQARGTDGVDRTYIIMVDPSQNGEEAKTIVIQIDAAVNPDNISICRETQVNSGTSIDVANSTWPLTPIMVGEHNSINVSSGGSDVLIYQEGTTPTGTRDDDFEVEI